MFEVRRRDGLARTGVLQTGHGSLATPALLPVINPLKLLVLPQDMVPLGAEGIITNSYIILRSAKLRKSFSQHGLHTVLNFPGPIMTDSGTFQGHVYGAVDVTPDAILKFQTKIGSDIRTILDLFTEPDDDRATAASKVEETLARASTASKGKGGGLIAAPVQGSVFTDLRARCARAYRDMDLHVHPIGGVVPLLEEYRYRELVDVVISSRLELPPERPVHLFGAGHPMMYALAVLMGVDMFDSAAYAKYAIDGRLLFPWGTRHLEDLDELPCDCPTCRERTPSALMEMGEEERVRALAVHNLSVSFAEVRAVRQAIRDESLWSYAAMRAASHPDLMAAYRHLLTWADRLEEYEPQSRKSEFISTPWDVGRPAFVRYRRRAKERISTPAGWPVVPIREGAPPTREQGAGRVVFHHPIGYIPWTLDQIYPAGLTMLPGSLPLWRQPAEACLDLVEGGEIPADDLQRVRSVCEYQFGRDLADLLLAGEIKIAVSRTSGRIRTVHADGVHILSMRNDGFFTLKPEGARRIVEGTEPPRMRIVVDPDSAPFNRKGRNVFCGFVVSLDEGIGLMEEVIVVDRGDEVLAVGRALLTGSEMTRFEKGLAVKVRQGVDQKGGGKDGGEGE